ncbi:receptor-like protein 6 [Apium graveolens]|uniref:receptor-like protein 6 n=1 Tax=Apium graveolens TaxID=4045 RepID=UPI003D7AA354
MIMSTFITSYIAIIVMIIFLQHHLAASLSPQEQKTALFHFKQSFNISTSTRSCLYFDSFFNGYEIPSNPKSKNWSMSSDYCIWDGVTCDHKTGDVIGLDLSCSGLEGAILPNSTLFQLSRLRFLNLSQNNFSLSNEFPQEFGFFAKGLTHLNLSRTWFSGRVPSGISHLHKLLSLDLSLNYNAKLEAEVFKSLLQNLTQLRVLNLEGVNISSVLPMNLSSSLEVLNLGYTGLYGVPSRISHLHKLVSLDLSYNDCVKLEDELFKSLLQNLTQLRVLNLEGVNISSVLPFNFSTSFRFLNLPDTGLHGVLPQEVFHLPNLEVLDLGGNFDLKPVLPKVKWGSSATLRRLSLREINFNHGGIPDAIGYQESLASLDLSFCNLSGPIPRSIGNLVQLTYLGLNNNNLNGPILTPLSNCTSMRYINLNSNNFIGPLPSTFAVHSLDLIFVDLSHNGFTGPLSTKLFNLPLLEVLDLSHNRFTEPLPTKLFNLPSLQNLDLSHNGFTGFTDSSNINAQSISQLVNLTYLDLSSNNFSGVLNMSMFSPLESLQYLGLSHNHFLSVRSTSMSPLPPTLSTLGLSSCNMKEFPHFSKDAEISLDYVDLSNNDIEGEIPDWIGSVGSVRSVYSVTSYLNISHNRLTGGLEQLPWNSIKLLDLQHNELNGSLPDLICNSSSLEVLNLSHNKLSGVLPSCGTQLTSLSVFDLRMNNIQGSLPANLSNFRSLETINLNGNKLEGRVPSSFVEFNSLRVLDLGNNQISDTFPQYLEVLPNLQVLVLKSNKFHGIMNTISKVEHPFHSLRIIDLSCNEFSGPLPVIYFRNFKAMMNGEVNKIKRSYMERQYYSDSTNLVIKGHEIQLNRILTVFTTIDLSKNNFEGKISEYTGNLLSLRFLNLSHNHLTGHIPPSIANLTVLESLDLSSNQLEGEIPLQLTGLYSLALLNLSYNKLRGHIPQGFQFNTFEIDSYVGNLGLCGKPLSKKCGHDNVTQEEDEEEDDDYFFGGFTWEAVVIGYVCGVVPAFIAGYLMLLARKPKWFAGIIARELGLKVRRMEIKWR